MFINAGNAYIDILTVSENEVSSTVRTKNMTSFVFQALAWESMENSDNDELDELDR